MHQAAEIKLQGKALGGKNKLVVCCIMCVCVFNSICVCVWETREKEKGDTRRNKKEKEEDEEGGKGIGMEGKWEQKKKQEREKRLTGPVCTCTHHPLQLESLTPPPPIRPFLQYITLHFWCLQSSGNEITAHITAAATALKKKKEISSAWNAFSYSFFPLMLLLLVFVQWFA